MKIFNKNQYSTIIRNSYLLILIFMLQVIIDSGTIVSAADFTSIQSKMYKSKSFSKETSNFTPYDKMYITVDFGYLHAGTYTLLTDWTTPWGNLEHQNSHSFEIVEPTPSYKVFSWLSLWKNGPFKRVVTGEDFKKEFYGNWKVVLYLNGKQVAEHDFEIH